MKKTTRLLCLLLILASLLCACNTGSSTTTTSASTKPVPTTPATPVMADINRPLPTLAEKHVTGTPAENDLVLAKDGVATAAIVIPQGHARARSAASDLASYLQKITGAAFMIYTDDQTLPEGNLILVGPTNKTFDLGVEALAGYPNSEKYVIKRIDNCLVLYGNDDDAYTCTQYAVNRFLEEAGCGWFSTEELWTVIPDLPTLAVKDWDQTFQPLFTSRTMGGVSSRLTKRWNLGGDEHRIGHGLAGLLGKRYAESNPEWYPEVNGQRPFTAGWYQYCYSNHELAALVAQKVIEIFDRSPTLTNYSIAANDGWDEGWCECENCAALGTTSDQILYFANNVAQIVSQVHPDRTLSILAYHATYLPPTQTVAHPNVEVMFCVETNPFTDPTLDWVTHTGLNGMTKVNYTQSWQDSCNQYIQDSQIQTSSIWAWFCISGDFPEWYGALWVQGNTVTRTFDLYLDMGIQRVFVDCSGEMGSIRWPLFYTYARSMWDDAVDGETILYDACKKLYGEAADEMFLYYRAMSDGAAVCVTDDGLTWVPPYLLNVYGDLYNEIDQLAENAQAKLDLLTPEQQERVRYHLSSWDYIKVVM